MATAPAAEIPSHVPPELIREIGLTTGPEFLAAPHKFMAELHETHPPLFYSVNPLTGNSWATIKHEDAFFALRHPEYFTTAGATPFPRDPNNYFYFIPLEIDPPHHRKYRAILDKTFSPQGVAKLEGYMRKLSNDLIDEFIDKGECEFTTDFGRPLPVSIFLDLMGLPQDMRDTFVGWAVDLLHSGDRMTAGMAMRGIEAYLAKVIEEKTANPDDGVIGTIIQARPDGVPLTEREIFGFTFFLFIAGLDTVFATLNNMWLWLANTPDRRREIIENPGNINGQVEELLRVFSVTFSGRTLTQDLEMRGVQMKAGDKFMSILPACNYDPEIFPNPTEIDFNRQRKPILAFAGGVHSCIGAHLARLEIKIGLQEWLRRIPDFSVKPGAAIEYYPGGVVGPKALPLVW
ncbi:cytochrome P450 [Sphingomonas cavernae]|uniref:Cytochrome P450 n=1 Tax=Sphingomonas cavernae TaxID=2320861 RepID=A0A418WMQ3_9SPHN|nr:cytochrome P450 [Sphingomonas cavernae]RJF91283.1 cytochrome P450 [Sphingomonas cavernae]